MKLSRRKFLTSAGLTVGAAVTFFDAVLKSWIMKAHAQEVSGEPVTNYVHLTFSGAPPRWLFDMPLTPNGNSDLFTPNDMLCTKFTNTSAGSIQVAHETTQVGDFHLPSLWASDVPGINDTWRPMSDLAQNMFMIRGVNMLVDGHEQNRLKQNAPVPGGYSLTGLLADIANTPLPAVYYGAPIGYKSKTGVGIVRTPGGDSLKGLMRGFELSSPVSFGNQDIIETLANRTLNSLREYGRATRNRKIAAMFRDASNAKSVILRDFGDLVAEFNGLRDKYENLIQRAYTHHNTDDVDNVELITTNDVEFRVQSNAVYNFNPGFDMRDTIQMNEMSQGPLNASIPGARDTSISNLSASMAVTEFLLVNELSNSLTLNTQSMTSFYLPANIDPNPTTNRGMAHDAHSTGAYSTLFFFSKFYKGFSACMLELVDQLKNNNQSGGGALFDNTLIHITSEFGRNSRNNNSGSDHAWHGSNITLLSGMIEGPQVVGNIYHNHVDDGHDGTWGAAAPVPELANREMVLGNVASSIANILKVETPTPNDPAILDRSSDGKIVSYLGNPENDEI